MQKLILETLKEQEYFHLQNKKWHNKYIQFTIVDLFLLGLSVASGKVKSN